MVLVSLGAALLVAYGIKGASSTIGPLFLTLNFFIAAWPVYRWLVNRNVPRLLATIALTVLVFTLLVLFFYSLGWSVGQLVLELPKYQPRFEQLYQESITWLHSFGVTETVVLDQLRQLNPVNFTGVLQSALNQVSSFVALITVIVVMIFLMAMDSGTFSNRYQALVKYQPNIAVAMADFVIGVRRYWVVSTVFGLIVAIIDVVILAMLGVPLALVWGILSFLTNYIPNVGFVLGLIPPALMALLANGPMTSLIVIVAYSVVNFVIQAIIQPKFNGDAVGVTASVSFLSLLIWSALLGGLGALLALPATLLVKSLIIDHDPQLRWLNAFISNDPDMANPKDALAPHEGRDKPLRPPTRVRPSSRTRQPRSL